MTSYALILCFSVDFFFLLFCWCAQLSSNSSKFLFVAHFDKKGFFLLLSLSLSNFLYQTLSPFPLLCNYFNGWSELCSTESASRTGLSFCFYYFVGIVGPAIYRVSLGWFLICEVMFECLVTQSCLTLCNPMDCRSPDSSVHGISEARILAWVAISFSRGSSRPRDQNCVSCIVADGFFTTEQPGKQLWGLFISFHLHSAHAPIRPGHREPSAAIVLASFFKKWV